MHGSLQRGRQQREYGKAFEMSTLTNLVMQFQSCENLTLDSRHVTVALASD